MTSNNSKESFVDIDWSRYSNAVIFLDIDGTLVPDSVETLDATVVDVVRNIALTNTVVMTSNSSNRERTERFAHLCGVACSPHGIKKPDPALAASFQNQGKRLVVVGDKQLVDGQFAQAIGAEFVFVRRCVQAKEKMLVRFSYWIDSFEWLATMRAIVNVARPRQWIKNLLVFVPAFFAVGLFDASRIGALFATCAALCLVASAVYALNDARDVRADASHPIKRARPVASGALSQMAAYGLVTVWMILGFGIAYLFAGSAVPYLVGYALLNIVYTMYLKHVPIVELIIVSSFYLVRIALGGAVANVTVSNWLILCAFFLSAFIVIAKRRAEVQRESQSRRVLAAYPSGFLDAILTLSAGMAILSYALYSVLAGTHPAMVYSTLFVVFAVFRYMFIAWEGDRAERPERVCMRDVPLLISVGLWFAFVAFLYYAY